MLCKIQYHYIIFVDYVFIMSALFRHFDCVLKMELPMTSRRKEIFFVALCVVFSALFTIGCSDSLLHPAQDGARILVQLENSSLRSGDTPSPTEKWQGSAWIENRDGSKSHHQDISSAADELSITFENVVVGSEIRIHLDVTSSGETAKRYRGSSSWKKIIDGVNVIVIVLKEVGMDAATPTIATQPEGETKTFAAGQATAVKKELTVKASVSDGGVLSYRWYSNNTNSTEGGTAIGGATSSSYEATVNAKETKYFYCVITNTNNSVTGAKTAATITSVVAVASVEGELTSITAKYTGSQGYMLVGQINHNDFTITETYTSGTETVDVTVTPNENNYTIGATNGDSAEAIGQVPYTVTRIGTNVTTSAVVLTKYELDVDNLTITGGDTVEQDGILELTAEYKVNGNDSYTLYISPDSSSSYKIIENVDISWTGDAQQSDDKWKALADTATAGLKTAIVELISKDEWCATTNGIVKSHPYTVNAATSGDSSGITDENSLLGAINQAQDGDEVTITEEITVTNTIVINKNIVIQATGSGKLLRSNKGTVTGPMFDVSSSGNLTLQNITLDGQFGGGFYGGENNPFVINNGGTLTISKVTLTNNRMSPTGSYGGIEQLYASAAIYSAGTTTIKDSTISEVSSNNTARGIVYGVSGSLTISNTNITLPESYQGNALYLESGVIYDINNKTSGLSPSYKSVTPTSP